MRSFYSIATTVSYIAMCSVTASYLPPIFPGAGSLSNNLVCIPTTSYVNSLKLSNNILNDIKKLSSPQPHSILGCANGFEIINLDTKLLDFDSYAKKVTGEFNEKMGTVLDILNSCKNVLGESKDIKPANSANLEKCEYSKAVNHFPHKGFDGLEIDLNKNEKLIDSVKSLYTPQKEQKSIITNANDVITRYKEAHNLIKEYNLSIENGSIDKVD
ncbi:hypothetical protein AYI69_g3753 [Smittium culicis]|uniref:Uncharacterized protein n=1 Tax=Smittium culicis TaxID=133412 RepID=A0A1R1YIT0_9FUNG|nr:hypothetical protein AYI69_g3753 [Smittium culicis]